jgi:hypothetical protein
MRCGRHTQQCLWLGPRRHIGSCWSAVTNADTGADSDKHGHTVRSGNTDAYAYSYGDCNCNTQCDSYSDSYCDRNANTERNTKRNTDSDTYCNSQRVAYGYAKGNAAAAWDAAAEAVKHS